MLLTAQHMGVISRFVNVWGHIKVRKRMGSYQGSYTSKMELVFGHPVTSDKNVWSQSISANENKT